MSQGCFNYRYDGYEPEDNWGPPEMADIFPNHDELSSSVRRLIAYLRASHWEKFTKRNLIPIVDSNGYRELQRLKEYPQFLKEFPTVLKDREDALLRKVDKVLSQHRRELRAVLREITSEEEKEIYLYAKAEVIVPVEEAETGAFVFSLHHPEAKLPVATLRTGLELYLAHAEKQQQPVKLYEYLKAGAEAYIDLPIFAASRPGGITTDIDTPDEEMDTFLEDESGT